MDHLCYLQLNSGLKVMVLFSHVTRNLEVLLDAIMDSGCVCLYSDTCV
jgi:hypothetical protein